MVVTPLWTANRSATAPSESRNVPSSSRPSISSTSEPSVLIDTNIAGWSSEPPEACPELPATT
jgi:hypothetical protein